MSRTLSDASIIHPLRAQRAIQKTKQHKKTMADLTQRKPTEVFTGLLV